MSGKGDNRRRENRAAVDHNWGEIDWNARERDAEAHLFLGEQVVAVEHDTPLSNDFYRRMVERLATHPPEMQFEIPRMGPGDPVYIGFDLAAPEPPTFAIDFTNPVTGLTWNPDDFGVIAVNTRETPDVSPTTYAELDAGPVLHFSRSVLPRATWWRRLWWRVCDAFTRPCMDP